MHVRLVIAINKYKYISYCIWIVHHVGTYILYRFKSNACVENEFDGLNNNNKKRDHCQLAFGVKTWKRWYTFFEWKVDCNIVGVGRGFTTIIRIYTRRHEFIARLEKRERVASTSTYRLPIRHQLYTPISI